MGRMKDLLMEEEEEVIREASKKSSATYSDILSPTDIFEDNCIRIEVTTVDGKIHKFKPDDIVELYGVSVKVQKSPQLLLVIPFDKIVSCQYRYL